MVRCKNQKEMILDGEWDCLIVLDACRYDYFRETYQDYLNGELKRAKSPGSMTSEWLIKTFSFTDNDIIYISGNPRANSKKAIEGFKTSEHFYRTINVWEYKWDNELKTVHPKDMGKATRWAKAKYPEKKIISHFLQPHYPFLSLKIESKAMDRERKKAKQTLNDRKSENGIKDLLWRLAKTTLGFRRAWKLVGVFLDRDRQAMGGVRRFAQEVGKERLREAYLENLKSALIEIRKIGRRMPGKIIVTSDHGEGLGEDDYYGHGRNIDDPILREVPWFEMKASD